MIPFLPLLAIGAGYIAYKKWINKGMTPERKKIYDAAMSSAVDPENLRSLADAFEKEGLRAEADMLRKRSLLREAPPSVKAARRDAFRKAMGSSDPDAILAMARAHEQVGAIGAAEALKQQAANVSALKSA